MGRIRGVIVETLASVSPFDPNQIHFLVGRAEDRGKNFCTGDARLRCNVRV